MNIILTITTFLIPFYFFRFKIFGIPTNPFEIGVLLLLIATTAQYSRYKIPTSAKATAGRQGTNKSQYPISNTQKILFVSCFLFLVSCLLGSWQAGWSYNSLGIIKSWVIVPMLYGAAVRKIAFSFQLSDTTQEKISKADSESNSMSKLTADTYNLTPVFLGLYTSVMLVSLWAIMQSLGIITTLFYQVGDPSFGQYLGSNYRVFGPFESPNYLAMFLVPSAIIALGTNHQLPITNHQGWKGAFYLSYLLPLSALLLTYSRAGLIALAVAVLVFILIKIKPRKASPWWNVFILPACVLIIAMLYKMLVRPGSDDIRLDIYQYSWQMVTNNPLLGIGIDRFQTVIASYAGYNQSFLANGLPYAYHPHNLYLALWLNFGLLGLISFSGVVAVFLKNVLSKPQNLILLAAMVAILVHGIFDTTYFKNDLAALFWLTVALGIYPDKKCL